MHISAWPAFKNRRDNPYNWLLYTHMLPFGVKIDDLYIPNLVAGRYRVWHIHWPDSLFNIPSKTRALSKTLAFAGLVMSAKAWGTKLVWTNHNLESHERLYPRGEAWFSKWLLPRLDGVIALSRSADALARQRYPQLSRTPGAVIPIGHYMDVYPNQIAASAARQRLGLNSRHQVVLFLGAIRPYKNIPHLIQQFKPLSDANIRLVIAGSPGTLALKAEIEQAAAGDSRIQLHLHYIKDEDIQIYFNAADIVMLPYRDILNSATALLALSFLKPVLVPSKGSMEELKAQLGGSYVLTFAGELSTETIRSALIAGTEREEGSAVLAQRMRQQLDWSSIAEQTLNFYKQLVVQSQ